ncbi:MAG: nucleotidyltransferase domain-containing protein [Bacteroidaceae bacterium]|nr:nucleotidyltransferase domain-containing protein [Bacteroidaceae bacterium]
MKPKNVLESIKLMAGEILPKGSSLYLYGSRARGDYHDDSDWDLLLLLDKPTLEHDDFRKYSYPFVEMGWSMGEDIRPHAYTKNEWYNGPHSMFYYNVEEDKKLIA